MCFIKVNGYCAERLSFRQDIDFVIGMVIRHYYLFKCKLEQEINRYVYWRTLSITKLIRNCTMDLMRDKW